MQLNKCTCLYNGKIMFANFVIIDMTYDAIRLSSNLVKNTITMITIKKVNDGESNFECFVKNIKKNDI